MNLKSVNSCSNEDRRKHSILISKIDTNSRKQEQTATKRTTTDTHTIFSLTSGVAIHSQLVTFSGLLRIWKRYRSLAVSSLVKAASLSPTIHTEFQGSHLPTRQSARRKYGQICHTPFPLITVKYCFVRSSTILMPPSKKKIQTSQIPSHSPAGFASPSRINSTFAGIVATACA